MSLVLMGQAFTFLCDDDFSMQSKAGPLAAVFNGLSSLGIGSLSCGKSRE